MRPILALIAIALLNAPAHAALKPGAKAPDFQTQGALAGKAFRLKLSDALKRGPVVLYFFPAAFTSGCTVEANAFAEATADFRKAGATVIGMSADPIEPLIKFSATECRNKFAVASASPAVIAGYDVALKQRAGMSDRTSYVIAPDRTIVYVHSDMNPAGHVTNTLAAVRSYKAKRR